MPVTGRPSRGRLYSGTARRDGAESPPELAADRLPDDAVFPPLEGALLLPLLPRELPESPLPLREVAVPELEPLRVRVP
jgi:hypothetical protein